MLSKITAEVSDVAAGRYSGSLGDLDVGVVAVDQVVLELLNSVLRKQICEVCVVRQQIEGKELLVDYVRTKGSKGAATNSPINSIPNITESADSSKFKSIPAKTPTRDHDGTGHISVRAFVSRTRTRTLPTPSRSTRARSRGRTI